MTKIYIVRHQAGGLLWQFPFAQPPTESQKAELAKYCVRLHGKNHPKDGEPYWVSVAEVDLLGPNDKPAVLAAVDDGSKENTSEAGLFGSSGTGRVTPKAGS